MYFEYRLCQWPKVFACLGFHLGIRPIQNSGFGHTLEHGTVWKEHFMQHVVLCALETAIHKINYYFS